MFTCSFFVDLVGHFWEFFQKCFAGPFAVIATKQAEISYSWHPRLAYRGRIPNAADLWLPVIRTHFYIQHHLICSIIAKTCPLVTHSSAALILVH